MCPCEREEKPSKPEQKRRYVYIFDLDGTLCDVTHRLHFKERTPPDHDGFYAACDKDERVIPILKTLYVLRDDDDVEIWYWSGRRESCREKTVWWLERCGIFFHEGDRKSTRLNSSH